MIPLMSFYFATISKYIDFPNLIEEAKTSVSHKVAPQLKLILKNKQGGSVMCVRTYCSDPTHPHP